MNGTSCLCNSGRALRRAWPTTSLEKASSSQLQHVLLPSVCSASQRRLYNGSGSGRALNENNGYNSRQTNRQYNNPWPERRPYNRPNEDNGYNPIQTERQNNNFRNRTSPNLNPNSPIHAHGVPFRSPPRQHGPRSSPTSGPGPSRPTSSSPSSSDPKSLPRDSQIRSDYVHLRLDNGRLSPPQPLDSLLFECQMKDQTLVTLALPSPSSKYPICIALDRKSYEESERQRLVSEKEKEREEKRRAKGTKELEINWATAPHDLEIKMRRLREFLGKGLRVEVRLVSKRSKKKGKREATEDEATEVLKAVRKTALEDVVGAREVRPPDGFLLKKYTLFLEGPQGKRKEKEAEEVAAEEGVAEATA